MKINSYLTICLSILLLFSCDSTPDVNQDVKIIIYNNVSARLSQQNIGVIPIDSTTTPEKISGVVGLNKIASNVVSDMPLTLIAEVAAPTHEGFTLRSTHVAVRGNIAYVSYNYEGEKYLGAIDVINIANPNTPMLVQSAIFPDTDISSLSYANGYLYLAGAKESYSNNDEGPAVLMKMKLNSDLLTDEIEIIGMTGYVATDVLYSNNYVYATSGNNGIIGAYNINDNKLKASLALSDLRAVGVNNGQVITLQNGEITVLNPTTLSKISGFKTSIDTIDSKRTIDFYNNSLLTSEGAQGVGIYNLSTGSKINAIPISTVSNPNIDKSEIVSNAVSVNNKHIFMANGAAGISVHKIVSDDMTDIVHFGNLALTGSANYVKNSEGYVFVADGFGGLKILKMLNIDPTTGQPTPIDCTQYANYSGGSWLNVNSGETLGYNGAASLSGINVNSDLTWCGSLSVSEQLNINSGGTFNMKGALAFGNTGKTLIVNSNSKFRIEGSLTIFGDLILNSGATLEFIGTGSSVTIFGKVTKGTNVTITGTFVDSFDKLK